MHWVFRSSDSWGLVDVLMINCCSQFAPICDGSPLYMPSRIFGQMHLYPGPLRRVMQVPPFWHGLGSQSSILISQFSPVNPAMQSQMWLFTPSMQVPPFWQSESCKQAWQYPSTQLGKSIGQSLFFSHSQFWHVYLQISTKIT